MDYFLGTVMVLRFRLFKQVNACFIHRPTSDNL